MSASVPNPGPAAPTPGAGGPPAAAGGQDPSMEDILASIRRILSEDEQQAPKPTSASPPAAPADDDEVLKLDETMLVDEPSAAEALRNQPAEVPAEPVAMAPPPPEPAPALAIPLAAPMPPAPIAEPAAPPVPAPDRLIAPEVEAATASALGALVRTIESGRQAPPVPVYRGGPTLDEMVREEIRPLLKAWLDANLPPMVERLVRAEIERMVGKAAG